MKTRTTMITTTTTMIIADENDNNKNNATATNDAITTTTSTTTTTNYITINNNYADNVFVMCSFHFISFHLSVVYLPYIVGWSISWMLVQFGRCGDTRNGINHTVMTASWIARGSCSLDKTV